MWTKSSLVLAAVVLLCIVDNAQTNTIPDALHSTVADQVASKHAALLAAIAAHKAALAAESPVNSTVKTNRQKIASRVSLISADAWAISYTAFKSARAAIVLMMGYMKASATGTITIDNMALLDFAATVAALNGELSDMLSRISKLNADAVAPLNLVKG